MACQSDEDLEELIPTKSSVGVFLYLFKLHISGNEDAVNGCQCRPVIDDISLPDKSGEFKPVDIGVVGNAYECRVNILELGDVVPDDLFTFLGINRILDESSDFPKSEIFQKHFVISIICINFPILKNISLKFFILFICFHFLLFISFFERF